MGAPAHLESTKSTLGNAFRGLECSSLARFIQPVLPSTASAHCRLYPSHAARGKDLLHTAGIATSGGVESTATGKFMRHVNLRPGTATNALELSRLIDAAYSDIKARVENG